MDIDSLLIKQVKEGKLEIVKFLVENGANINSQISPLITASKHGHLEIVKYLLDQGININYNIGSNACCGVIALNKAAINGHLDIVKVLVERCDLDITNIANVIDYATTKGNLEIVKYLIEHYNVNIEITNAMQKALFGYHMDIVNYLLEKGANLHFQNDYMFRLAIYQGNLKVLKYMIEHGSDIHYDNDYLHKTIHAKNFVDIIDYVKSLEEPKQVEPEQPDIASLIEENKMLREKLEAIKRISIV